MKIWYYISIYETVKSFDIQVETRMVVLLCLPGVDLKPAVKKLIFPSIARGKLHGLHCQPNLATVN